MIVPSGKRRQQIAQGDRPYESILDSLDDIVTAQVKPKPFKFPTYDGSKPGNDELATALQSGNNPGMSGLFNEPGGRAPGDRAPKPDIDSEQDMNVSGPNTSPGMEAGNRWLAPDGSEDEEQASQDILLLEEKRKLRQAAGQGFAINMKRSKDGMFELLLIPPRGYSIPQPDDFAATLMQTVRGVPEDIGDPDPNTGAMKIVYRSQSLGQPKIEKAKGRR